MDAGFQIGGSYISWGCRSSELQIGGVCRSGGTMNQGGCRPGGLKIMGVVVWEAVDQGYADQEAVELGTRALSQSLASELQLWLCCQAESPTISLHRLKRANGSMGMARKRPHLAPFTL